MHRHQCIVSNKTSGQSKDTRTPFDRKQPYSPGGANVPSHEGTLAPPGEYD